MTRRPNLTDGQSGFRAFSPAAIAAAEVVHDYNYAQVLTLDLLAKGFTYAEVPIRYSFRSTGTSFVSPGRYLRKVLLPCIASSTTSQSSTTWLRNDLRARAQAASSNAPPGPRQSAAPCAMTRA